MAHLLAEADEIQSQCKTQRAQYVGLDEASLKSDVRVRTGPALKPCTVANIVGDTIHYGRAQAVAGECLWGMPHSFERHGAHIPLVPELVPISG